MKITDIHLIQGCDSNQFINEVYSQIKKFENNEGEVEVQYSNAIDGFTIAYSALILRRQK